MTYMTYEEAIAAGRVAKKLPNGDLVHCDGKCNKAWGINLRTEIRLSETNIDDNVWLADDELGEAPDDPGTYEGFHGKPSLLDGPDRQNKWCVRECERPTYVQADGVVYGAHHDFTRRVFNIPSLHKDE